MRVRGVLTGCAVAIALTGTIVLSHAGQRRALTLIPDYHLCVVFENQVVETVPEAMRQLERASRRAADYGSGTVGYGGYRNDAYQRCARPAMFWM